MNVEGFFPRHMLNISSQSIMLKFLGPKFNWMLRRGLIWSDYQLYICLLPKTGQLSLKTKSQCHTWYKILLEGSIIVYVKEINYLHFIKILTMSLIMSTITQVQASTSPHWSYKLAMYVFTCLKWDTSEPIAEITLFSCFWQFSKNGNVKCLSFMRILNASHMTWEKSLLEVARTHKQYCYISYEQCL